MQKNTGMLIGAWSGEKDLMDAMRGSSGGRTVLRATVRANPGTKLMVDGASETVPESGMLVLTRPQGRLSIDSAEKVHAKIEYEFDETLN